MNPNKNTIFLFIAHIANFYLVPFLIKDTGSGMFVLLVLIPTVCFTISVLFGKVNGFRLWYPCLVVALFLPSVFLFYNSSALSYTLFYGIVALVGNLTAKIFFSK